MPKSVNLNQETTEKEHLAKPMGIDEHSEREEFADLLVKLLFNTKTGATMCIDAPYGYGKTYFMVHLKRKIEEKNANDSDKTNSCTVLSIDAWKTDWAPDPLIVIVNALLELLADPDKKESIAQKDLKELANSTTSLLLGAANQLIHRHTGVNIKNLVDGIPEKNTDKITDYFKDFKDIEDKMLEIKNKLSNALESNNKGNVIVFVDELDRCRPRYIIDFLMRIKHIFNIPRLIFVISMSMDSLRGACNSEFGKDKNADIEGYINRFFHPRLTLPPTDRRGLIHSMDSILGRHFDNFYIFLNNLDMSPRCFNSAKKYYNIINSLHQNTKDMMGNTKEWVRPSMMYAALFYTLFSAKENENIIKGHSLWEPFHEGEESILGRLGIFERHPDTLKAIAFLHLCFLLPEEREVLGRFDQWYGNKESENEEFGHEVSGRKIPDEYLVAVWHAIPQSAHSGQLNFLYSSGREYLKSLQTLRI